jgi:hypothetical protein
MLLSLLLWPLRKAALLPAAVLSSAAFGAAYGSYDLSRRAMSALVPLPAQGAERPGTTPFSLFTSFTFTCLVVAAREALLAPAPIPTPLLPVDSGPFLQRLRNSALLVRHHTLAYPVRFRFMTAFVAGCVGGCAQPVAVAYYNAGYGKRAAAGAPHQPALGEGGLEAAQQHQHGQQQGEHAKNE